MLILSKVRIRLNYPNSNKDVGCHYDTKVVPIKIVASIRKLCFEQDNLLQKEYC